MSPNKPFHALIAVLLLGAVLLGACAGGDGASADQTITLTDGLDRTVTFEQVPQRVVIAGRATVMVQDTVYLFPETSQRLVALENRKQSACDFLPVIDPLFEQKTILEMNAGPEQITPTQPDVVILKSFMAESLGNPLEELGIPVVYLDLESPERYYQDITALGQLFNAPDRAEELLAFYQDRVKLVEQTMAPLTDAEKPTVLLLQHSDSGDEVAFEVPPATWLQTYMVETAGGVPVWLEASEQGGWTVVSFEQIAAWNPDQIYIVSYDADSAAIVDDLKSNPLWAELDAVKSDQIYGFAADFYSWDQPDTRWILGMLWLATKVHPELTADIDIMAEIEAFYTQLYSLDQATIEKQVLPILKGDLP